MHLTFTTQKNGDKGTILAHSRISHCLCYPVQSAIRQLMMQQVGSRKYFALCVSSPSLLPTTTPIVNVPVTAAMITPTMWCHATFLHPKIDPFALSARFLRAGGAMALFQCKCDSITIKLLARWHSDAMTRYLHRQFVPIIKNWSH